MQPALRMYARGARTRTTRPPDRPRRAALVRRWRCFGAPLVPVSSPTSGTVAGARCPCCGALNATAYDESCVEVVDVAREAWTFQPACTTASAERVASTGVRAHRVRSIAAARDPSRISRRSAACADGLAPAVWLSPRALPLRDAPRRAAAADDEGRKRESRRRLAPPSPPPPPPPSREGAGRPRMLITRKLRLRVVQA